MWRDGKSTPKERTLGAVVGQQEPGLAWELEKQHRGRLEPPCGRPSVTASAGGKPGQQ